MFTDSEYDLYLKLDGYAQNTPCCAELLLKYNLTRYTNVINMLILFAAQTYNKPYIAF